MEVIAGDNALEEMQRVEKRRDIIYMIAQIADSIPVG